MYFKAGVRLERVHYLTIYGMAVADLMQQQLLGAEATVTSVQDGGDSWGAARVAGSLHPGGMAFDLRTRDMDPGTVAAFAQRLQAQLGGYFQVLVEADHIHVELNLRALGVAV